jgi:3-isopropylmalate/(R)-2-methylmalate dehydratase large subunit
MPALPGRELPIKDEISLKQITTLEQNCREFGITLYGLDSPNSTFTTFL